MGSLKKHLEQPFLFENNLVKKMSECDFIVKLWGPLIEKAFKSSSVIPHWGDTLPASLVSVGVKMRMDLRLVSVGRSPRFHDTAFGEFAKNVSSSKYFKDKRKAVVAAKALLNDVAKICGQDAIHIEI
ncbi:hypothetical protein MBANPS3_007814 [Mucor bainieri]